MNNPGTFVFTRKRSSLAGTRNVLGFVCFVDTGAFTFSISPEKVRRFTWTYCIIPRRRSLSPPNPVRPSADKNCFLPPLLRRRSPRTDGIHRRSAESQCSAAKTFEFRNDRTAVVSDRRVKIAGTAFTMLTSSPPPGRYTYAHVRTPVNVYRRNFSPRSFSKNLTNETRP